MDESLRVPIEPVVVDSARRQADQQLDQVSRRRRVEIDFDDKNYVRKLGAITGQADEFSKSMEAANARVLAFGASVGVINSISAAFKNLITSTVEVEKSLTEIRIIGNQTFSDLGKTSSGIFGTAKQLGVSYKDAAASALEFARQGKGLAESLDASRAALALTRTAGIAATEAVMGLTSAVNAFGRGADAYIEYANKMSAVSDAFAVNNKDLIEGLSRSASVAQEAGVSFEELTALITTLQEKTGRGGAVIGNALKTIFTRVQNPEIIKDLRDLGIAVQDEVTGNFLSATQIIKNLANEFQGFDKNLKNSVLLKVGGGFQVDKIAALLNDVKSATGTFQRSFDIASSGGGNILAKVAELNKTIDASFTNILTSSKQLGSNIGQISFSKDFVKILETGSSALNSLNEAIFGDGSNEDSGSTFAKGILKGIGSVLTGPGLALFAGILGKLAIDFGKFSTSGVQALLGITSKTKEEQLIQKSIASILAGNVDFQTKLFSLENNKVEQARLLLSVYKQQAEQVEKISSFSKNLAPNLYAGGVRLGSGTPQFNTSAAGYIPNLASAVAKEKAESPAGSRIIVDRNFPMGGGERSTMVYNSNETRIRNFAGTGGDAIIPNYPVNSAKGFVPNFADEKKDVLNIDASQASIAGLTYVGKKNKGVMEKAKPVTIDEKLLSKYSGSPFVALLDQFKTANVVNLPVGNVYKFRKGLEGNEKQLKKSFVEKLNSKFRDQVKSFLSEEISGLGLAAGGGINENLSNLKLDVIGYSTAGYIFEEILKIPTLTNAEKVAQYANQSDTDFFDIKNLDPTFAEAYGLPKRSFDYAEIKFGEKELFDGITKKMLNQFILSGGGANPKKFGVKDTNRAASGYIPNFAESIDSLKSRMKGSKQKGSGYLQDYYDVNNEGYNDSYDGNVQTKYYSLDKTLQEYTSVAENELNQVRKTKNFESFKRKVGPFLGSKFNYEKMFDESDSSTRGTLNNIKGALAEKDFENKFKNFKRESNEKAGIDFYNGNELIEIKARGKQFSQEEANAKALAFLGSKSKYKNKTDEDIPLSKVNLSLYETYKSANKNKYLNAAKGYIPNFSELTGSGAGMLYQDPNFNELGGGQSGKFLAPKSGEGFGQKIFYKLGSDKINQELQVNKSIKDFEKENPALFAKNAISFTNVGKLLTKNGLAAGFEREVIGGLGVDDFATEAFAKPGQTNPKAGFAFYLSELLAQTGVKNVVGEYRNKYGQDSLRIDDIYAQNFKVNDIMQKLLIDETNQFFKGKKNVKDSDVDNYIRSLNGNPLVNSLNEKFGSAGGRHTMFDTQGFAKNASKGYVPNFAKLTADILTVNPAVAKLSVDQFIEKYLGSEYSTGLSGTSANAVKITGNPQQMAEAKRDFIMSMLGPNFLATYERDENANKSRRALISQKSTATGTRVKREGGFMRAYGNYAQTDLSAALEGTFSGEAKRLKYEDLDTKAEKIFEQSNLTQYWNEIVKTMQLVGNAYTSEMVSANNAGVKPDFDYNTVEVPEEGKFQYGLQVKYRAKDKIKQLTALIRPKLIEGLLEGEKGVQGLVLNQPEYDKESSVKGDYFILLDEKAAQLKKLVSDYLINPDLDPLQVGSREQSDNKYKIKQIIDVLDGTFGSSVGRKGIFLDQLKEFRKYSEGNPQLQKFFMDGEDRPGAFIVGKTYNQKTSQASNKLGAFLKPDLPQSIIEKIATVLAASYNRDGIFPLSNLDVGYTGQLSYAGSKNNPLIDTFATSPNAPAQASPTSIPSTLRYGKYLEKKDYYDSVAKWKYDPASKSMIRQAAKGYIPNFSKTAINEAVIREQMQSGLPSSQISLTQDSRLSNNLNPSGFAVINKRDEPNGKVPANRIADAYKNAGRGFIPNFTTPGAQLLNTIVNTSDTLGANITNEQRAAAQAASAGTQTVTTAQKKLSEQILDYITSINLSDDAQDKIFKVLVRYERSLDSSANLTERQVRNLSNRITRVGGLSDEQSLGLRNVAIANASAQTSNAQAPNPQTPNTQTSNAQTTNTQQEDSKKAATKSFGDLALSAFKFQSVLSATSGFLSAFGKDAEKVGEIINTLGQGAYAATQGLEVFKTISGGKSLTSIFTSGREGLMSGIASASGASRSQKFKSGLSGLIGRAATPAVAATETTAAVAGTAATGLGGGMAAAGAAAGTIALVAAGLFLGGKAVDQFSKIVSGANSRTEKALNAFSALQEKYNIQLSERSQKRVSALTEASDVSGAGLSGVLNQGAVGFGGSSFRYFKAKLGFKDENYKDELTKTLGTTNLTDEGNKKLAELLGPFLEPIAFDQTATTVNGKLVEADPSKQKEVLFKLFNEKIKQIQKVESEIIEKYVLENINDITPQEIDEARKLVTFQEAGGKTKDLIENAAKRRAALKKVGVTTDNAKSLATEQVLQELAPKALEAEGKRDSQKQGILIRTELLKKQLEIRQQIAKLEASTPSALESALSIQKELLSNDEAQKFALELRLKALQEERQTRAELKDLISSESRKVLEENLGKTAQLGVVGPQAENITKLFGNLQSAQTVNDQKEAYKEIVQNLNLAVKSSDAKRKINKEQNDILLNELDTLDALQETDKERVKNIEDEIKKNSDNNAKLNSSNNILNQILQSLAESLGLIEKQSIERQKQNAQLAVERSIIDRTNYYFNLRKEMLSSMLEIQNKSLQRRREELSLAKETRDVEFQRSQFLNAPQKTQAQGEYETAINSARENRRTALENLSQRQQEVALQNRQAMFGEISSRAGNDLDLLNSAARAKNDSELQKVLEDAVIKQGGTFEDKVISAAKEFYRIINKAAVDSKAGTADQSIINEANVAKNVENELKGIGSVSGVQARIDEIKSTPDYAEKGLEQELTRLEDAINKAKEYAAVKAAALKTQGPDEKKTKGNIDTKFATEREMAELEKYKKEGFGGGIMTAYDDMKKETDSFANTMGKSIPLSFRDSMVSAMRELSNPNSTEPLKNRLLGVAASFLQKINDGLMQNLANQILKPVIGGLGSVTGGAGMPGASYASGGIIKGGSGSKDDVPAMLMGGEYVLTKSAVKKYGPSFLDALNNGKVQKFAEGGWVESDVTKYQDPATINPYGQRRDQGLSFNENGQVIGMDSYTGTAENKQDAMMRAQSDYYAKNAQTGQGGFYMPGENGMGAIMGQRNLLSFATQQTAGTRFDRISGAGGVGSVDLGAGSSNMSLFGLRDQDNSRNAAYLESKQKSLDLYLGGIDASKEKANREEEIRKEQERIKQEAKKREKDMIKGILTNLAISAAMAGVSALGSAASKGWSATNQASGGTATFGEKFQGAFTGGTMGGETRGGMFNAFSSSGYKDFSTIGAGALGVDGGGLYSWNKEAGGYSKMSEMDYNKMFPFGASYDSIGTPTALRYNQGNNLYGMMGGGSEYLMTKQKSNFGNVFNRKAAGGYVAGNGMGDNVPSMLNGGEFVISKQATQNIGTNKLQQINSGASSDSSEMIAAKLDELVEKLSAVGTLNITVNSDSSGRQQTQEQGGNQDKETKELARRIKEVVMVVLKDEKRLGGMLR